MTWLSFAGGGSGVFLSSTVGRLVIRSYSNFIRTPKPVLTRIPAVPKVSKEVAPPDQGCPVCRKGLQYFGYRDVLLLRQFLTPDGYIIGRRHTRICPKLQRRVARCIRRARKEGLLPNFQAKPSEPSS